MKLQFITPDSPLYRDELELRFRVLRQPLGMARDTVRFAFEGDSMHLVAVERNRVLGCVLFHPDQAGGGRLFQMAVAAPLRGQGWGRRLVRELERRLIAEGFARIELHARQEAVGFYEGLGYRAVGAEFTEVGIPHRIMERQLD